MSAPLLDALRARFQRCIAEGLSARAAAFHLKLSPAVGARWALAIRRTGRAEAAPLGRPRGKGKLDPHRAFLADIIKQDRDIAMPELSAALHDATGVQAHPNAVGKILRKLGFTYKKSMARPVCKSIIFDGIYWSASTYKACRSQAVAKMEIRTPWS